MNGIYDPIVQVNPGLATARAALLRQIQARPVTWKIKPAWTPADLARQSRLADAKRILRMVEDNQRVAAALGLTPRTTAYWRASTHAPTAKHWVQLNALRALLVAAGIRVEPGAQVINRTWSDAAD